MKKLFVVSAALALASCGQRADTATEATPSPTDTVAGAPAGTATQAPTGNMAGKYEITTADGTRISSTLNADGTYVDIAKGEETRGVWRMNGAQTCFEPSGDAAERCYTTSAPGADGSFQVTGADGTTSTLRKVGAAPTM